MQIHDVRYDCRFFRGELPCRPNKDHGYHCTTCPEYRQVSRRILIIKLGALGDVIRTTPLIVRFREMYPDCHITWITQSPDILPKDSIDRIYKLGFDAYLRIKGQHFDIAINLDKEPEACMLLTEVTAREKYGFAWNGKHIVPATPAAEHKLITGFFDDISQHNKKSYLEEIFEICHLDFRKEPYLLPVRQDYIEKWTTIRQMAGDKKVIGLNTGCGARWATRMWPSDLWVELIRKLQAEGYFPMVLGGPDEDEMNKHYHQETGCFYPGTWSLEEFMAISSHCDVIVTAVSMMMHIATGLEKPMVLFNNIFNPHEFELYGRGEIVSPDSGCECYFGNTCKRSRHCMMDLPAEKVFQAVSRWA